MQHQANKTRVHTIMGHSPEDRDNRINNWLEDQADTLEVLDMDWYITLERSYSYYYCSIIYTEKKKE